MSLDRHTQALMADVDACEKRVEDQLTRDATHELALAMFAADLRRARARLALRNAQMLRDTATAEAA